jgi:hypothetical protein
VIAANAHQWYQQHAAPALARFVADTMHRLTAPSVST